LIPEADRAEWKASAKAPKSGSAENQFGTATSDIGNEQWTVFQARGCADTPEREIGLGVAGEDLDINTCRETQRVPQFVRVPGFARGGGGNHSKSRRLMPHGFGAEAGHGFGGPGDGLRFELAGVEEAFSESRLDAAFENRFDALTLNPGDEQFD